MRDPHHNLSSFTLTCSSLLRLNQSFVEFIDRYNIDDNTQSTEKEKNQLKYTFISLKASGLQATSPRSVIC